jgi:hypothetical protein
LVNKQLLECHIIALAEADQAKNQRSVVYSLAVSEIKSKVKEFRRDFNVKTSNGTHVLLLAKIDLTDKEKEAVLDQLSLSKL